MNSGGTRVDRKSSILLVFALVVALIPYAPLPARAATLSVPSEAYPTIQDAVNAASSGIEVPDVIEVAADSNPETTDIVDPYLESVVVDNKRIQIRGVGGSFRLEPPDTGRPLTIDNGGSVYLLNATIANGDVSGDGGGILVTNSSRLDLQDSVISNNRATRGGGVAVDGSSFLSLVTSLVASNTAATGGGVYANTDASLVEFIDTEISGNTADGTLIDGSGHGGGLYSLSDFSFLRTTVHTNLADAGGAVFFDATGGLIQTSTIHGNDAADSGGGFLIAGGEVTIGDSTLTANRAGMNGNLLAVPSDAGSASIARSVLAENQPLPDASSENCDGFGITSGGYNFLDGTDACSLATQETDLINADGAQLGPLFDNGGHTRTRLPLVGSPVIDAISTTDCPTEGVQSVDQRLTTRPQGEGCDIGSVEVGLEEPNTPPDLVGSLSGPAQACLEETIGDDITLQVTNQGATLVTGTDFSVGVYLSADATITTSDALLVGGREFVADTTVIGPGDTIDVPLFDGASVPATVATGSAFLGLVVDEFNAVAEADETNNTAAVPITIQEACDAAGTVAVTSVDTGGESELQAGYAVPLAEIPPERLLVGATTIAGAPMAAIELDASPMAAIPMAAIPMAAIGGDSALGQTLLSEIPIEGGWEPLLVDTPHEGRPLQTLTLDEVADDIDPLALLQLNLGSLRIGNTGLADLSLASLMLGDVPLADICADDPDCGSTSPLNTPGSVLDIETAGGSIAALPMAAIPMAAIPMGAIGDLASAPMGAIPMAAIPMGAIPLGAIGDITASPLAAIPMGAIANLAVFPMAAIDAKGIPMAAIPMAAIPMGAIDLSEVPMAAIPMGAIGGGCGVAVVCPVGIDNSSTVDEFLVATGSDDIASSPMAAIPMGAIPMGAIPMGAIDMNTVPMAAIPMAAIDGTTPLGYLTLGDVPLDTGDTVADVCDVNGAPGTCDGSTTLAVYAASLSAAGHENLAATPMAAIELGDLPMAAIPMAAIDLNAALIAGVPMAAIEFDSIDLVNSPMGAIPMAAIPSCVITTSGLTVLEAAARGELCEGTSLGDVDPAVLDTFTLGDVLNYLTLGFLGQLLDIESQLPPDAKTAFGGLTYGEIVISILLALDFPWEDLPLDQIETRDVACGFDLSTRACLRGDERSQANLGEPDIADVSVDFTVSDGPVVGEIVEVTIPEGWVILPGSAQVTNQGGEAGPPFRVADPRDKGDGLFTFTVPQIGVGVYTLQFAVAAGFDLGQNFVITAEEVSAGDDIVIESLVSTDPISVVEGLEFGDLATSVEDLDPDTLWVGYINRERDQDWWSVEAPDPGFRVAVYLSNLAGDVDTFVYRPATAPIGSDGSQRDVPLPITPIDDDDVDLTGGGTLSPELLGDSALEDLSGSVLGDGSANRGDADEFAEFFSRHGDTDDTSNDRYTIQVAGFQDATSESPYVLRVRYRSEVPTPSCDARTEVGPVGGAAPAIPNNVDTIFLVNWDRMEDIYPEDLYPGEVAALRSQLQSFASSTIGGVPVNGVVVPIGSISGVSSAFSAWDTNPCDASAANDIADLVVSYIQGVASTHPTLRHVSIIGGDEVVPLARLEDEAIVANESTYTEGFDNNALYGAHFTRHYLSDAPYGDLDPIPWLDRFAYIKDLGVGRLVESPGDISGAISTFQVNNGVLDPNTMASAGYDFLTDGAEAVRSNLGGLNELTGAGQLISESWTAAQLGDLAYGASGGSAADVISPNAHYDHHRLLPASENATRTENDLFTITELGDVSVPNRIVFTMGCHSGLSVDDKAGGTIDQPTDWAQVYGAQQAVYIGNTGYGYGDTATVALSEQMMANLAGGLGNGQTIAQNLSQAGQDQFGKAGLYGVYDLKAIEEATLYGLPMWRVNVSGRSPIASNGSDTGPVLPDSETGLLAASFSKAPVFAEESSPDGNYFTADGGTQFMHWRPITPKTEVAATQEGLIATGAVLTDLVSRDVPLDDPVFARPNTTDAAGREPEVEFDDIIFPTTFATLGTFELLNPDRTDGTTVNQQSLNLLAGQFVGPSNTQRLFDRMDGQIYYAPDDASIDWTPPTIVDVEANVSGSDVGFSVTAEDPDSGVSRVVVLFRSSEDGGVSDWTSLDLVPLDGGNGNGTWAGGGTTQITQPDYIVQVLNGNGVSDVAVFKGDFYQAEQVPSGANQPPAVEPITAPTDPVQIDTTVNASAPVTDEDLNNATAIWSWGDGTTSAGTVPTGTVTTRTVTGSHVYSDPGVYRVRLVVVDTGGLVGESSFEFVVAYDPEGGFVTGGGWIDSPPGAYTADPSLTGKATFGFVSRYQKGKTVPQGQTTFKFNTANLDFRSIDYEWLVISGNHKAQYKGSGTINGGGAYKFILTAIDAENTSSTQTDLFRIKIWWEDETGDEHVVYDNELEAPDDADPTTAIAGGSIVIHSAKSGGPK